MTAVSLGTTSSIGLNTMSFTRPCSQPRRSQYDCRDPGFAVTAEVFRLTRHQLLSLDSGPTPCCLDVSSLSCLKELGIARNVPRVGRKRGGRRKQRRVQVMITSRERDGCHVSTAFVPLEHAFRWSCDTPFPTTALNQTDTRVPDGTPYSPFTGDLSSILTSSHKLVNLHLRQTYCLTVDTGKKGDHPPTSPHHLL